MKRIFAAAALIITASAGFAQSFEPGEGGYTAISTYDSWEQSPFRTGILEPNAKVVANPDPNADNPSQMCVAYQRSRYASNRYGVRVDLAQPFELDKPARYIHVLMHRPKQARVMCIGLGRKRGVDHQQGRDIEQFRVTSINEVGIDGWHDAVFYIRGAGDIDIHSLVFVTDLESPHNLSADHIAYIDDIVINNSSISRTDAGNYPLNFDRHMATRRTDRRLNAIAFAPAQSAPQSIAVADADHIYSPQLTDIVTLRPGEAVTPSVDFSGAWMNAFLYIDYDADGRFDIAETIAADNPTPHCDLVAYSAATVGDQPFSMTGPTDNTNTLAMGQFTIPADTPAGFYRARLKIDYLGIDPAGRIDPDNCIYDNGGKIVDFLIHISSPEGIVTQSGLNGELKLLQGTTTLSINSTPVAAHQPLTIIQEPAPGFTPGKVVVRYGYNLDGPQMVKDTPQWFEVTLPREATDADGRLTIPAQYLRGTVHLQSHFLELPKAK